MIIYTLLYTFKLLRYEKIYGYNYDNLWLFDGR